MSTHLKAVSGRPGHPLTSDQLAGLGARFPRFDADRAAPLFHQDQTGTSMVEGHEYPCVLMRNGVRWHYDRNRRPRQKTMAPSGMRTLLTDDPELTSGWLVVVEGEGDAVALASVGQQGIACVGGTNRAESMAPLFAGKRVYLLFDRDQQGKRGAREFAKHALGAGAEVHLATLPDGQDPEEWLAQFETPDKALAELQQLLGAAERVTEPELDDEESWKPRPVAQDRVRLPDGRRALVVTAWDRQSERFTLLVYGPSQLIEGGGTYGSLSDPSWRQVESLSVPDKQEVWVPETRYETPADLRKGRLVMPPADLPGPADSTAELWRAVRGFLHERLHLRREYEYDLLAAFVLAAWVLHDHPYQAMLLLYLRGRPGTGKSTAMRLLQMLGPAAFSCQPTADGVHRMSALYREGLLALDELNFSDMPSTTAATFTRYLKSAADRGQAFVRLEKTREADPMLAMIPLSHDCFGARVLAGESYTSDEAVARRSYVVQMPALQLDGSVALPDRVVPTLEIDADTVAAADSLRTRLLAWRAGRINREHPSPRGSEAASRLREAAGHRLAAPWWPLVSLCDLPEMAAELGNLPKAARASRSRTEDVAQASTQAVVARAMVDAVEGGHAWRAGDHVLVRPDDLVEEVRRRGLPQATVPVVRDALLALTGVRGTTEKVAVERLGGGSAGRRRGVLVPLANSELEAELEQLGVVWPPQFRVEDATL